MDIEELRKQRSELITKTDMMEAAGVDLSVMEADYQEIERIDHALWEHDFGESLNALCALPQPSDLSPQELTP